MVQTWCITASFCSCKLHIRTMMNWSLKW